LSIGKQLLNGFFRFSLGVEENKSTELGPVSSILVVRQHNQLGDLLISTPLFTALKEKYPHATISVIVSPANHKALRKNSLIDNLFVFDKSKLLHLAYFKELRALLKSRYDLVIVPSVTSLSFTSNLLARLSNSRVRIGPASVDGKINSSAYFFDRRVELDWRERPETHVTQRNIDIVTPFGIGTKNKRLVIDSDLEDETTSDEFIKFFPGDSSTPLVGIHVGAGKLQNRWDIYNFLKLLEQISNDFNARIYLTQGGEGDRELVEIIRANTQINFLVFDLPGMPLLKSLIQKSDLFISNDTGPMHVVAATDTPAISLFGPTDPRLWAPLGDNKHYLWKGEDINLITVEDVYTLASQILRAR